MAGHAARALETQMLCDAMFDWPDGGTAGLDLLRIWGGRLSLHQMGLVQTLKLADLLDMPIPEIVIIAMEPKRICPGTELTPEIEKRIPALMALVREEAG